MFVVKCGEGEVGRGGGGVLLVRDEEVQMVFNWYCKFENCIDQELYLKALIVKGVGSLSRCSTECV